MTRPIGFLRHCAASGFAILTLCLLVLAGCSEGGASASGSATADLDESDIIAIGKTAKTHKAFKEALKQKTMEKAGIVLPTKASGTVKRSGR